MVNPLGFSPGGNILGMDCFSAQHFEKEGLAFTERPNHLVYPGFGFLFYGLGY